MNPLKEQSIKDLFSDIADTCFENDLSFWYSHQVKHISIRKTYFCASNVEVTELVDQYLDDGDTEDILNGILHKINEFLEGEEIDSKRFNFRTY